MGVQKPTYASTYTTHMPTHTQELTYACTQAHTYSCTNTGTHMSAHTETRTNMLFIVTYSLFSVLPIEPYAENIMEVQYLQSKNIAGRNGNEEERREAY